MSGVNGEGESLKCYAGSQMVSKQIKELSEALHNVGALFDFERDLSEKSKEEFRKRFL